MKSETMKLLEDCIELTNTEFNVREYTGITSMLANDYRDFLKHYNGGNGDIGDNTYLHLWNFEDIEELNEDYGSTEFLTDIVLIGSDGGDTAYGINSKGKYIEVPFIGMDDEEVKVVADDFDGFIEYLHKK